MGFWRKLRLFGGGPTSANDAPKGTSGSAVTFLRDERKTHPAASHIQITKKIYAAQSREAAIAFLRMQKVSEPFHYVEVDTPSGKFGIDNGERIYDGKGQFIDAEPEPETLTYDTETSQMRSALESAMAEKRRQTPPEILAKGEAGIRCLRVIINDASAEFFTRRMAIWWGGQFNNAGFKAFLNKRFVEGKDRVKLYQKAESSQSEAARAEMGLHIAAVEVLSGKWKP